MLVETNFYTIFKALKVYRRHIALITLLCSIFGLLIGLLYSFFTPLEFTPVVMDLPPIQFGQSTSVTENIHQLQSKADELDIYCSGLSELMASDGLAWELAEFRHDLYEFKYVILHDIMMYHEMYPVVHPEFITIEIERLEDYQKRLQNFLENNSVRIIYSIAELEGKLTQGQAWIKYLKEAPATEIQIHYIEIIEMIYRATEKINLMTAKLNELAKISAIENEVNFLTGYYSLKKFGDDFFLVPTIGGSGKDSAPDRILACIVIFTSLGLVGSAYLSIYRYNKTRA